MQSSGLHCLVAAARSSLPQKSSPSCQHQCSWPRRARDGSEPEKGSNSCQCSPTLGGLVQKQQLGPIVVLGHWRHHQAQALGCIPTCHGTGVVVQCQPELDEDCAQGDDGVQDSGHSLQVGDPAHHPEPEQAGTGSWVCLCVWWGCNASAL